MKRLLILSVLVFLLAGQRINAQANLAVKTIYFPDSALMYSTLVDSVTIWNTGNQAFSGFIQINYRVDSSLGIYDTLTVAGFAPGDSVTRVNNSIFVDTAVFETGINVVVIWPSTVNNDPFTSDSTEVYVVDVTGVFENLPGTFEVFPNPAAGFLEFRAGNIIIYETLLMDLSGKIYSRWKGNPGRINISGLEPGIYFLRLTDSSGRIAVARFIRN